MKARLYRGELHYHGLTLHTAASGAVHGLDTLWLKLERDGVTSVGEVRLNIGYLHGYSEQQVLDDVTATLSGWPSALPPQQLLTWLHQHSGALAPSRMLLDMALHDLLARQQQQSVAQWLGATSPPAAIVSNQTLFWSSEREMLAQAQRYVDRGFRDLKLRTGIADFATDCARLTALRTRFGDSVTLAIDVNGSWQPQQAAARLEALLPFGLSYVEQPLAPQHDHHLAELLQLGLPLMLDESLNGQAALDRLCELRGPRLGHLKLVKLGGIAPTVAAARQLSAAGVPFMIGQMNEGHVATAAAWQLCRVLSPQYAELYGADGLVDDPASGLDYQQGTLSLSDPQHTGLGVSFDAANATLLQEFHHATAC